MSDSGLIQFQVPQLLVYSGSLWGIWTNHRVPICESATTEIAIQNRGRRRDQDRQVPAGPRIIVFKLRKHLNPFILVHSLPTKGPVLQGSEGLWRTLKASKGFRLLLKVTLDSELLSVARCSGCSHYRQKQLHFRFWRKSKIN